MQQIDPGNYFETLIIRFLRKETSSDEIAILERWLKESPDHRRLFKEISATYEYQHRDYRDVDLVWRQLSKKIQVEERHKPLARPHAVSNFSWLKMAAVFALFIVASLGVRQYLEQTTHPTQEMLTERSEQSKRKIILPDGTTVWLNTHSAIHFNANFGTTERSVSLEGEAFFDVAKTGKTFIVHANNLEVVVKGTRFNVKTSSESKTESATLEHGSIVLKVKGKEEAIEMTPGEQLNFNRDSREVVVRRVNPLSYSAWKEPRLQFVHASLASIIEKIEMRYQVSIKVDPVISTRENLSMTIEDETLEEVLELITISSSLSYKVDGDEVVISE